MTESPGGKSGNVRKSVTTYDAAGRQKTSAITGGGVPAVLVPSHVASFIGKKVSPTVTPAWDEEYGLRVWVYPNGFQEKHLTGWDGLEDLGDCPTAVKYA